MILKISLTLKLLTISTILLKKEYEHRFHTNRQTFHSEYDFIVVGSGAAGAIVAARLAEDHHIKVLLLEAGGPSGVPNDIPIEYLNLYNTEYDWNYTMAKQPFGLAFKGGVISENRGKVFGGSTSINGMVFNRGNRKCFDHWSNDFGAVGWSYEEVLPYFKKWERNTDPKLLANGYHGDSGPVEVTSWSNPDPLVLIHQKVMNELGIKTTDINGPVQLGTMIGQATINLHGRRSSTSNSYLNPNPYPDNLHTLLQAFVKRVLFHENKAIGVEFIKDGKVFIVRPRKEVIVSGGAINSPQLLMLSGIGPRKQLEHFGIKVLADLPVGEHHQNHPSMNVNFLIKDEYQHLVRSGDAELNVDRLYEYYTNNSGVLRKYYNTFTYLNTLSNPDRDWPNIAIETINLRFPKTLDEFRAYKFGDRIQEWDDYHKDFYGKNYVFTQPVMERPRSLGYVRLRSDSPFVYPEINPRFLTHPLDFEEHLEVIKFLFYFYERSPFARYVEKHKPIPGCEFCPNQRYVYECVSYIRCLMKQKVYTGYHACCTNRMGDPNRPDTVVDPRLRVKGFSGLRVCDASVMPLVTNGNTNAPSMMIGEKCADLIKEDNHLNNFKHF